MSSEWHLSPRIHNTVDQYYEFWVRVVIPCSFRWARNDEKSVVEIPRRRLLWWYHVMITTLLREHSLSFLQIRMNFAPLYFYTDDLLSLKPHFMNHEGRYLCRAAVNQELSTSWWWAGIMSLSSLKIFQIWIHNSKNSSMESSLNFT